VPVVAVSEYAEKSNNSYSNWFAGQYYGNYSNGYYNDGYYNDDYYGKNSWCQPYYLDGKVYCYPNQNYCNQNNWFNCNYGQNNNCCNYGQNNCCNWQNTCKCNNVWPNNCGKKQNACGNNANSTWSYCLKHPKCCGWK
jgi:hypothetical protein